MSRFINPVPQFWLNDGSMATSGKMVFFENGDYSTKKNTYANSDLTTANTNPVTLDGQGRMPACFGEGLYSVKFYAYDNAAVDNLGTLQWTRDDVSLSNGGAEFSDWSAVQQYEIGDATKDNGEYYILYGSATSKGERPSTTPLKWEEIAFLTVWNSSKAASSGYDINDIIEKDGKLYRSLINANATTPPSSDWGDLTFNDTVAGNFSVGGDLSVTGNVLLDSPLPITQGGTGGTTPETARAGLELPSYETTTVAANGDFTSGTIRITRIGNIVTISSTILTHASLTVAQSAAGLIPAQFRPPALMRNSYGNDVSGTPCMRVASVSPGGIYQITYVDFAGSLTAKTASSESTISYVI